MPDITSWVRQLFEIRAEVVSRIEPGAAADLVLRVDRLLGEMAGGDPATLPDGPVPDITPRSAKVFNQILGLYQRTGKVPSPDAMCGVTGIASSNGIEYQLDALEAAGLIRRDPKPAGRGRTRAARGMVFLRITPIPAES